MANPIIVIDDGSCPIKRRWQRHESVEVMSAASSKCGVRSDMVNELVQEAGGFTVGWAEAEWQIESCFDTKVAAVDAVKANGNTCRGCANNRVEVILRWTDQDCNQA
jgi:hypothetical protein